MRRFTLLAALCAALVLAMAPTAFGQTVQTTPNNPDGSCPEGFVQVNAPFCAQESPNTPGRIFGFGEGDLAPEAPVAPSGVQYADPETTSFEFDPEADCSTQALINANPFGCFIPSPETVGSEFTAATTQDAVNRGLQTQEQACEQPVYLASIFAPNCGATVSEAPNQVESTPSPTTTTTAIPATGGPSLALLAGALLIGADLVLRRR